MRGRSRFYGISGWKCVCAAVCYWLTFTGGAGWVYADPLILDTGVIQTLPASVFTNDPAGQIYQISITNSGTEPAENLRIELDIPDLGFIFDSGSLTNDRGRTFSLSGTDPVIIAFSPAYALPATDTITLTYRMPTDCSASGFPPLSASVFYEFGGNSLGPAFSGENLGVESQEFELRFNNIDPADPFEVSVGDTVRLEAEIENTGSGRIFGLQLNAEWGTGFGNPTLVAGGSLVPTLGGDAYSITIDQIDPDVTENFIVAFANRIII